MQIGGPTLGRLKNAKTAKPLSLVRNGLALAILTSAGDELNLNKATVIVDHGSASSSLSSRWFCLPIAMFSKRLIHGLFAPRRLSLWLVTVCTLFLFYRLNIHTPQSVYDDTTPRFLYRSHFRDDPDFAYERNLSIALQGFEQTVLAQDGGDGVAEDQIWQIAKDADHRGPDSISLEQANSEWKYSVSLLVFRLVLSLS